MSGNPVTRIMAVPCERHDCTEPVAADLYEACWYSDGEDGEPMFCADRIKIALGSKVKVKRPRRGRPSGEGGR